MKKTILQFKNVFRLWQFKKAIAAGEVEINLSDSTLSCYCNKEQIQLAVTNYGATLIRDKKVETGK